MYIICQNVQGTKAPEVLFAKSKPSFSALMRYLKHPQDSDIQVTN